SRGRRCRNRGRSACRRRSAPQHTTCCRRGAALFVPAWPRIRGYPRTGYPSLYPRAPQGCCTEDGRNVPAPALPEQLVSGNERTTTHTTAVNRSVVGSERQTTDFAESARQWVSVASLSRGSCACKIDGTNNASALECLEPPMSSVGSTAPIEARS